MPVLRRRPGFLSHVRYRFVDCRWSLDDPGLGRRAYLEGHIPGAVFLDVERDLSAPPGRGAAAIRCPTAGAVRGGRRPRAGIEAGVFVVAYGSLGGAERLWWLLRHFGHDDCAVLDLDGWRGPLRGGEETVERGDVRRRVERARRHDRARRARGAPRASSSSSTRASRAAGAASRTRSTACRAGSPAR